LWLLAIAFFGPWAFDQIMVPAQYNCSYPNLRLEGDFCGVPLSGLWILWAFASEIVGRIGRLVSGVEGVASLLTGSWVFLWALLLLLPFFSTLLLILKGDLPIWQKANLAFWGLAAGAGLFLGLSVYPRPHLALWGVWLYLAVAFSMLIWEGLRLTARNEPLQGDPAADGPA
jgi:hypothetical protein